jgi:hypothetical protein
VFFDELGPSWPKHPRTDNPVIHQHFSSSQGRALIPIAVAGQSGKPDLEPAQPVQATPLQPCITDSVSHRRAEWAKAGWMPIVVTKLVTRSIGNETKGRLFVVADRDSVPFLIVQASDEARFYQTQGQLRISFSLLQNLSPAFSALNERPVLLKPDPDLKHLTLSSFILTQDGELQEVTLSVFGVENAERPSRLSRSTPQGLPNRSTCLSGIRFSHFAASGIHEQLYPDPVVVKPHAIQNQLLMPLNLKIMHESSVCLQQERVESVLSDSPDVSI